MSHFRSFPLKVDFDELETNLLKLEEECKASWEHLELIYTKHTMSREFYRKWVSQYFSLPVPCSDLVLEYVPISCDCSSILKVTQFDASASHYSLQFAELFFPPCPKSAKAQVCFKALMSSPCTVEFDTNKVRDKQAPYDDWC